MIYHFILNPKSGRPRKHKNLEELIKNACKSRCLSYHIYYTTCPGDATEYVCSMIRISSERQRFICVGGDGTLNEIVNSAPSNPNVEFGVIPYGSGNDFVRNFANKEVFSDINAQIDGKTISLDLIKCNDFYSVNLVNIGFDCACAKFASKMKKHKFISPQYSYTLGVLNTFFKKYGTKMKFIFDNGEMWDGCYTLATIANGKYYGSGYCAAPKADLTDGIIDICAVDKVSRFSLIKLLKCYKAGAYFENENAMKIIKHCRVNHFKMEFERPEPICIDGEIKGAKSLEFTVVKNAFNFVVPTGAAYINELN